jgi:hypothetical protein
MWCEGTDATNLQTRIRALGSSVGPNNIDLTTAEVIERDILSTPL